jgi:hypothetical protein
MQRSVIGRYSLGVVAENKPLDTNLIQVIPVEALNLFDGELSSETVKLKDGGLNEDGSIYTLSVEMGATIEAEWFGTTNRFTSPDVRRGEQVWIWQSENADKYYWTSLGRDDDLRRLETVIYRWSGFPDIPNEEITLDNSYYFEVSTHKNVVTLQTSQRHGEFCRYTFQFDTGNGRATIQDDIGNVIQIDSAATNITAVNADGTRVELDGPNIETWAPGWAQHKSVGRMLVKSETRLILKGPSRYIVL